MTLPVPVVATLRGAGWSRDISREARNLRFRLQAPGGFASVTADLDRPLWAFAPEVAQYAVLRASDARNASILCEGRLEDPGLSVANNQNGRRLSALGAATHAQDEQFAYVAVDSSMDDWVIEPVATLPFVSPQLEENPDIGGALRLTASPSGTIPTGANIARWSYPVLYESGQTLAAVQGQNVSGLTPGSGTPDPVGMKLKVQVAQDLNLGMFELAGTQNTAGTIPTSFAWRHGVDWIVATQKVPMVLWDWQNFVDEFTAGDATWVAWRVIVRPHMHTAAGATIPASSIFIPASSSSEIVADLLGTRLPKYAGASATIDAGTSGLVTQFAYRDPVTVDALLADLIALEGDAYYWAAYEDTGSGARFEWVRWPTTPRYELEAFDGLDLTGSTAGLYNAVIVRWRDTLGRLRTTRVTSSVDALTNAGLNRTGLLDLGENAAADQATAMAAGAAWLARSAVPTGGGTVTVARPVLDRLTGRIVLPHELRPGCLAAVRGIRPSAASITGTARDGVSLYRVVAVEYDAASASATLDLDSPPPATSWQLSRLDKDFANRRRS